MQSDHLTRRSVELGDMNKTMALTRLYSWWYSAINRSTRDGLLDKVEILVLVTSLIDVGDGHLCRIWMPIFDSVWRKTTVQSFVSSERAWPLHSYHECSSTARSISRWQYLNKDERECERPIDTHQLTECICHTSTPRREREKFHSVKKKQWKRKESESVSETWVECSIIVVVNAEKCADE